VRLQDEDSIVDDASELTAPTMLSPGVDYDDDDDGETRFLRDYGIVGGKQRVPPPRASPQDLEADVDMNLQLVNAADWGKVTATRACRGSRVSEFEYRR
jgi:hypothetical protein